MHCRQIHIEGKQCEETKTGDGHLQAKARGPEQILPDSPPEEPRLLTR